MKNGIQWQNQKCKVAQTLAKQFKLLLKDFSTHLLYGRWNTSTTLVLPSLSMLSPTLLVSAFRLMWLWPQFFNYSCSEGLLIFLHFSNVTESEDFCSWGFCTRQSAQPTHRAAGLTAVMQVPLKLFSLTSENFRRFMQQMVMYMAFPNVSLLGHVYSFLNIKVKGINRCL